MCGMVMLLCSFHPLLLLFKMHGNANMLIRVPRLQCKLQRSSVLCTSLTAEFNQAAPSVTDEQVPSPIAESIWAAACLLMHSLTVFVAHGV